MPRGTFRLIALLPLAAAGSSFGYAQSATPSIPADQGPQGTLQRVDRPGEILTVTTCRLTDTLVTRKLFEERLCGQLKKADGTTGYVFGNWSETRFERPRVDSWWPLRVTGGLRPYGIAKLEDGSYGRAGVAWKNVSQGATVLYALSLSDCPGGVDCPQGASASTVWRKISAQK